MKTHLSQSDRARMQAMTAALVESNTWPARIRRELAQGPMTQIELADVLARHPAERQRIRVTVCAMRKRGELRLRPMLEPAGRAVRVAPVVVLELVEQGSAAA